MKKESSYIVKGIAILLMIFHHLYLPNERYQEFGLTGFLISVNVTYVLACVCKVCVSLFVFVTAYGTTIQERRTDFVKERYVQKSFRRYFALIKEFAFVFFLLLAASYFFGLKHNAEIAWGESLINQCIGIVCNVTGTAAIFNVPWFNASWWYMSLAILLIYLIPLLHVVVKKIGPFAMTIISLYLVDSLGLSTVHDGLLRYLLIAILGIIFAEYEVLEKIGIYFKTKIGIRYIMLFVIILSMPCLIVLYKRIEQKFLAEAIITVLIVCLTNEYLEKIPVLSSVLQVFGRYSMYIWWIHSFFTSYWFKNFTYSFNNIWLIFVYTSGVSLLSSIVLSKLSNVISRFLKKNIKRDEVKNNATIQ